MRVVEFDKLRTEVEQLTAQVHGLDNAKGWLERRLTEAEVRSCYLWLVIRRD